MDAPKLLPVEQSLVEDYIGALGWAAFLAHVAKVAEHDGHVAATVGQNPTLARALSMVRRDAKTAADNFPN